MQVLFAWDCHNAMDPEMAHTVVANGTDNEEMRTAAIEMAKCTWDQLATLDAWIQRLAPRFAIKRQPGVDRCLLRLAAWEITSGSAPAKVVIMEAVDLAKEYSTAESAGFINAVLDAMLKEHKALTAGQIPPSSAPNNSAAPSTPAEPPAGDSPADGKGD